MIVAPPPAPAARAPAELLRSAVPTRRHALHDDANEWPMTNCYVDLWIELLHALGLDPVAGLAPTLALDFVGDQWTFFKYSLDDLQALYGIDVQELLVWRPLIAHAREHVGQGRPLIVDVDAWFLPDTAGITYHARHDKTSIAIQAVDASARRLAYFHNAGFHTLEGPDFDGIFYPAGPADRLVPYIEVVKLDGLVRRPAAELSTIARDLARRHFARRPRANPFARCGDRLTTDAAWLTEAGIETFHLYAFGMVRLCGAGLAAGAAFLRWLAEKTPGTAAGTLARAADEYQAIGGSMKTLQFALARAVSRKRVPDLAVPIAAMAGSWDAATCQLASVFD